MKIPEPQQSFFVDSNTEKALRNFIEQPGPKQLAPCPGCQEHIVKECSSKCPQAPLALSIEPTRYPIERNVIPIVYELMTTRLIQTCWSCEGHMNNDNQLWKLPQVCFYTASTVYVKLLCRHLAMLNHKKLLNHLWHIVISDLPNNSQLIYSIQPNLNHVTEPHLGLLQQDLNIIADDLHSQLKLHAQELIDYS